MLSIKMPSSAGDNCNKIFTSPGAIRMTSSEGSVLKRRTNTDDGEMSSDSHHRVGIKPEDLPCQPTTVSVVGDQVSQQGTNCHQENAHVRSAGKGLELKDR